MSRLHQLGPGRTLGQGEPADCCRRWRASCGGGPAQLLVVDFALSQTWLDDAATVSLTAVYCLDQGVLHMAVTDIELIPEECSPQEQFQRWVGRHGLMAVSEDAELELQPREVAKPWGREIWYSGVEQRGVCGVVGQGASVPLPWLRAVMPGDLLGPREQPLLLLKLLEPSPEPVTGDLYFELHLNKHEAYIVSRVDPQAWPDGTGYIRFGFCADKRARWPDDTAFRQAYLQAVRRYEGVRREIDGLLLQQQPVAGDLIASECVLRAEMDSFTRLQPLRRGDVLAVPPLLPHALQHGVSTVEFQTPVYERKILSFAQRVLTQDHWDTEQVVSQMLLESPAVSPPRCLLHGPGLLVEQVIDFPDFQVWRARLAAGSHWLPEALPGYALLLVFEGSMAVGGRRYEGGRALLLPRGWQARLASADPAQPLVLLLAMPRC